MIITNYENKKTIIEQKYDVLVRKYLWLDKRLEDINFWRNFERKTLGEETSSLKSQLTSYDILKDKYQEIYSLGLMPDTLRVINARRQRVKRLRSRIETMLLNNDCVFLTLTFMDRVLSDTSQDTRRQYVRKYLKSQFKHYVANIDFGKKNDREHYHALIVGRVDLSAWRYGAINAKTVFNKDAVALAKYIDKITAHALKASNKLQTCIYSRDVIKCPCVMLEQKN